MVGDEINRASPKTQSALLESMEERQVTVDGVTYALEAPFMVVATQNPIEMEGTYPLPEAQRDRFTARIAMGYPDAAAELAMLDGHGAGDPILELSAVADAASRQLIAPSGTCTCRPVKQIRSTSARPPANPPTCGSVRHRGRPCSCCGPRGVAALEGRDYVVPDDVQALAVPVLAHRIIPTAEAQLNRRTTDAIVADIVHRLALPTDRTPRVTSRPAVPPATGATSQYDQRRR